MVGGFDRARALERLSSEQFDVLVIGGGITGAGVALDAASRGLRTALVEKGDFSSGTSSRSSKLVHGGLRYLRQHEFALVHESLAERQRLLENAAHLVTPLPFLIPLFGHEGVVSKAVSRSYASALWLYDIGGGWRIGSRHRRVGREEAMRHLPTLRIDELVAGFLYFDAHADDARLTLAVLRTAVLDHGAVAANYAGVSALVTDRAGRVAGARIDPSGTATSARGRGRGTIEVRARAVVNATGIWADDVRGLAALGHPHSLRPAKGVHVSVARSALPCDIAAVLPVRGDRRTVFVVPWPDAEMTYVGTTDTDYAGPLDDPVATPEDVDYLLAAVNDATTTGLGRADVTGVWAGLRPLLSPRGARRVSERTSDLSRRHSVSTSPDGLVTVTGGKLTTYRQMAEDTMRQVAEVLSSVPGGPVVGRCVTKSLRLRGAPAAAARVWGRSLPVTTEGGDRLFARYGTEAGAVQAVAQSRPDLWEPVVQGLPYTGAEVVFAVREEMARTVEDVLSRRTRAALQDAGATAAGAGRVARLMAPELGWSEEQAADQAATFTEGLARQLEAAGLASAMEPRR